MRMTGTDARFQRFGVRFLPHSSGVWDLEHNCYGYMASTKIYSSGPPFILFFNLMIMIENDKQQRPLPSVLLSSTLLNTTSLCVSPDQHQVLESFQRRYHLNLFHLDPFTELTRSTAPLPSKSISSKAAFAILGRMPSSKPRTDSLQGLYAAFHSSSLTLRSSPAPTPSLSSLSYTARTVDQREGIEHDRVQTQTPCTENLEPLCTHHLYHLTLLWYLS